MRVVRAAMRSFVAHRGCLVALSMHCFGFSCDALDDEPVCDPYACDCSPGCDECPPARASSPGATESATCVGAPACNADADCPAAVGTAIRPICQSHGDLVVNGFGGECVLPCTDSSACGDDRECISGRCATVTLRVGNPCVEDADCVEANPALRCIFTACDAPGTCSTSMPGPCRTDLPVCTCDGVTLADACAAFPRAIAHEGACSTP